MRKVIFLLGIAVGFIVGARAGRERYDQLVSLGKKAAGHPAVRSARQTATAKATDLGKSAASKAAAKVPDLAKTAAPKIAGAAKQAGQTVSARLPFGGRSAAGSDAPLAEADGTDTTVPYQADGTTTAAYNGTSAL